MALPMFVLIRSSVGNVAVTVRLRKVRETRVSGYGGVGATLSRCPRPAAVAGGGNPSPEAAGVGPAARIDPARRRVLGAAARPKRERSHGNVPAAAAVSDGDGAAVRSACCVSESTLLQYSNNSLLSVNFSNCNNVSVSNELVRLTSSVLSETRPPPPPPRCLSAAALQQAEVALRAQRRQLADLEAVRALSPPRAPVPPPSPPTPPPEAEGAARRLEDARRQLEAVRGALEAAPVVSCRSVATDTSSETPPPPLRPSKRVQASPPRRGKAPPPTTRSALQRV
ncbi:potassium/sodium hyperpolarization-activated cyclic nucleotide-gated channel 2-like [Schistocerca americana]|uniref:potassium/sodium hyperpolarization-activated cyclic nucleotide-gated channel 2-like n=1 Tax=Schistocerca americana TaxID=7009 RepID=UPI001F4FE3DC|nr:potassium/sodium hyperpolarization-activated cyclic nucleotide-gated channel 2-like [Schistocerca americana]